MKYIEKSRRNPVESLNIIVGVLKNPLPSSKPFAELDALYAHILHPPETDLSLVKRILHCIIGVTAIDRALHSPTFDGLLDLPPGTTTTTLCDLHSVLYIPESKDDSVRFHHKSLQDYLLDPERSSDLFQSPYETQLNLTMLCATHLTRWGSNPVIVDLDHIHHCSALHWGAHLKLCIDEKPASATLPNVVMDLDPRNTLMLEFAIGYPSYISLSDTAKALHAALCSKRHCVRLCQLTARVNNCFAKCSEFNRVFFSGEDLEGRLNALSKFKSETGLFAPLHSVRYSTTFLPHGIVL